MNPNLKKYIPYLCLFVMILFSWLEESFFEGGLHVYLFAPEHIAVKSLFRVAYIFILFTAGYIGLRSLSVKWLLSLWIVWYIIVLLTAGIAKFPVIFFNRYLAGNAKSFLVSFYDAALTPFPYIFLLFLYFIITKKNK